MWVWVSWEQEKSSGNWGAIRNPQANTSVKWLLYLRRGDLEGIVERMFLINHFFIPRI
jgi:hypothetical protein